MNGAKKWHSPDGPAFNPGEVWEAVGGHRATIVKTIRWGVDKWDVAVFYYSNSDDTKREYSKDAWNFQVRYEHQADKEI